MFWRKMSFILISSLCLITLILPTKPKQANASSDFQNLHLIVSIDGSQASKMHYVKQMAAPAPPLAKHRCKRF